MGLQGGALLMFMCVFCLSHGLMRTSSAAPVQGGSGHKGRKLLAASQTRPAAGATVNSAAAPNQAASTTTAVGVTTRQLLQEHECYDGDYWIQCNSQPLCWGIGRSAPSTECGPFWMCESMCNTAEQNGGVCARLWNAPSESYYYSINYEGAVYCDPPGGGSGGGPKPKRPPKKPKRL
ncbi:hypothetical protein OEZ86_009195 [Tetradesmus obliquus]|nr:hypothetical protein OEZ86_009195 [Tetradesmus obliquus]